MDSGNSDSSSVPSGVPDALNQRRYPWTWKRAQATTNPPPGAAATLSAGPKSEDGPSTPRGIVLTSKSGPRGLPEGENRRARRTVVAGLPGVVPSQTATKLASARPTTDTAAGLSTT